MGIVAHLLHITCSSTPQEPTIHFFHPQNLGPFLANQHVPQHPCYLERAGWRLSSTCIYLLILGLLVREAFPRGHKLAQLPANHLLGHVDLLVDLAVVDAELVADQLRRDGGGALLRADDGVLARGDLAVDFKGEDVGPWVAC